MEQADLRVDERFRTIGVAIEKWAQGVRGLFIEQCQDGEDEAAPGRDVVDLLKVPLEPAVLAEGLIKEPGNFPAILGADVAATF